MMHKWRLAALFSALTLWCLAAAPAWAGAGPQNVVLVVDPAEPEAQWAANHYLAARGLAPAQVLYLPVQAADYRAFTAFQVPALLGSLRQRGLEDTVDIVLIASSRGFYLAAPGLIRGPLDAEGNEQCPVRRFSLSAAWTLAYNADEILAGGLPFSEPNRYYANDDSALAFDAGRRWLGGQPSESSQARRYLLGYQLGYTGQRGNTITDTLALIDRSVAADGSQPAGTFYFMQNDDIRSRTRAPFVNVAVEGLARLGFRAEVVEGELPIGRHDALGIMAGSPAPPIAGADFGLVDGAWADHLTSFAATFDTGSQVKMSEWLPRGASGTMGTVEEPCVFGSHTGIAYREKFPHPRLFTFYAQGLSLGEALFRSIPFTPFQGMFYGDPLTRPFAHIPEVSVANAPAGPVSGALVLRPQAHSPQAGAAIAGYTLLVDGQPMAGAAPDEALYLNTELLPDGPRELRLVAHDDTPARVQGAWTANLEVRNRPGRAVSLSADAPSGQPGDTFRLSLAAAGGDVAELQLRHNGRVLAAAAGPEAVFNIAGALVGSGRARLEALARYSDGGLVSSAPLILDIGPPGSFDWISSLPGDAADPVAFSYSVDLLPGVPLLLDLPALDVDGRLPQRELGQAPHQAAVEAQGGAFLLRPEATATGSDELQFVATRNEVVSPPATVTLRYCTPPSFLRQPADTLACPGEAVTLVAEAEGAWTYQWYKDGALIPGALAASYTIPSLSQADEGDYHVRAYARCGATWLSLDSNRVQVHHGDCAARGLFLPWAGTGR